MIPDTFNQACIRCHGRVEDAPLVWVWLLNFIFQRLVVERLATMLSQIGRKQMNSDSGDELDALQASLGSLRCYVRSARQGAKLEPNFINDYTVTSPLAAGAMSWLYSGRHTKDKTMVGLKIGFEEAMRNPLYRGCYEMELHLFEALHHSSLPK